MSHPSSADEASVYLNTAVLAAGDFDVDGQPGRLVAVTADRYVIFDGQPPTSIVHEFDRESTSLQFGQQGHDYKVTLGSATQTVTLSAEITAFGHDSAGRRAVLEAMGSPSV